ncbi:putative membrane protein [Wickerhamomyces ciferrii]|uniref:Membrane protein n=1 Tax=Wickerhamomyces ciferrii (strain ATCC 14091 / BCRC 22168 / CBS 111 / JCM 3599 / NBRC 0793 / NRRL Y-1031 F-60-10) TaxID=1206466 RepID=K0KPW5_WICCF|nr:uncharacterized protein BN7_2765 [Wickerhamomyces ciferrii]CCH43218.1 putative membrane protein [Wickerhamomyces ciferrii]
MLLQTILTIFHLFSLIQAHSYSINEYTSEICSYTNKSIILDIKPLQPDYRINYLIFHYKDADDSTSNIPQFKEHGYQNPVQCLNNTGELCKDGQGYEIEFQSDKHDVVINSALVPGTNGSMIYNITNPGFYCAYFNTDVYFHGEIEFETSFGGLDVDNYTRLGLNLAFAPFHFILLVLVLLLKYPTKLKWLVGLITLIRVLDIFDLGLIHRYDGDNLLIQAFHLFIKNICGNLILGWIIYNLLLNSIGYGILEDESMISKTTTTINHLTLGFIAIKIFNEMYFDNSLLPFYDLHFSSIRRYLLLIKYIPYVFVYVAIVFEFKSLQKTFQIHDYRIIQSFGIFTAVPIIIVIFNTGLSILIVHKLSPGFYDIYFQDKFVLLFNIIPEFCILVSLSILSYIWRPSKQNNYEPVPIELENMNA